MTGKTTGAGVMAAALLVAVLGASQAVAAVADLKDAFGAATAPTLAQVYNYDGVDYCWNDEGWNGPGWYDCGYADEYGYGWGGPFGWHGWRGGHERHRWDNGRGPGPQGQGRGQPGQRHWTPVQTPRGKGVNNGPDWVPNAPNPGFPGGAGPTTGGKH